MEQSVFDTVQPKDINKNAIPVRWGIIIGLASCVLSTIDLMFLSTSFIPFMACFALAFIITVILFGVVGKMQRKAMGGYITLKEAFRAIFIVILISTAISTVYGIIYTKFIDPDVMIRIKTMTLEFMEKFHAPQDKLDDTAKQMDEQSANGLKPGTILYQFFKTIIWYSIFGFIVAAIVSKKKPENQIIR